MCSIDKQCGFLLSVASHLADNDVNELVLSCYASCSLSLLGGHPNTYSFTKQLAENVLLGEHGDVPVAIVRPSIGKQHDSHHAMPRFHKTSKFSGSWRAI